MNFIRRLRDFLSPARKPDSAPAPRDPAPVLRPTPGPVPASFARKNPRPWQTDYPPTIGRRPDPDDPAEKLIFDPALKHYARAFRRGDPDLPAHQMRAWQQARRRALHHLLETTTTTPAPQQFILRGSTALKARFGYAAREPGDIDWVVQPASLSMDEPASKRLLDGVIEAVKRSPRPDNVTFDISAISRTDIWTYERAPGHRIAFPWSIPDCPPGLVEMDFVFEETLFTPPALAPVQLCPGPPLIVLTASDEESLAWKLLWLFSDCYPQGKDLYDAVLLAESTPLRADILQKVLRKADAWNPDHILPEFPFRDNAPELDWDSMPAGVLPEESDRAALVHRLCTAIRGTMEECRVRDGA